MQQYKNQLSQKWFACTLTGKCDKLWQLMYEMLKTVDLGPTVHTPRNPHNESVPGVSGFYEFITLVSNPSAAMINSKW